MLQFKDIEFGKSSGENESSDFPQLVKSGFYDIGSVLRKIKLQSDFLILGNKGTGKSLLAEKLRLDSEEPESDYDVIIEHFQDFPYTRFAKICPAGGSAQEKYPMSWSWILLLILINSIKNSLDPDNFSSFSKKNMKLLEEAGLFPVGTMNKLVITSSKKTSSIKLADGLEYTEEIQSKPAKLNFISAIDVLKKIISETAPSKKMLLILDGLDDINATTPTHFETINALIFESDRLNNFFKSNRIQIKIIVLCRIELFEQLPNANKNKLRQDKSILLNWYDEHTNPKSSNLILLANKKASISLKEPVDIFEQFFSKKINGNDTIKFLLSNTRYTPRDFIQLLNYLKDSCTEGEFTDSQVAQALKRYSIEYFLPEVKDEVVGYVDFNNFESFILLLGEMKKREFSWHDISNCSNQNMNFEQIKVICNTLFNCGVIGNKWKGNDSEDMYEFKYRNRNAIFDTNKRIVLHRAIWKSLNIK